MASALLQLLSNPAMRSQIAADARERALSLFTVDHQIELYRKSYENLARLAEEPGSVAVRVQLHLERADALLFAGDTEGALAELTAGLEANPQGPQGPVILLRMAEVYLKRGQTDLAMLCSERSEALAYLIDTSAA